MCGDCTKALKRKFFFVIRRNMYARETVKRLTSALKKRVECLAEKIRIDSSGISQNDDNARGPKTI